MDLTPRRDSDAAALHVVCLVTARTQKTVVQSATRFLATSASVSVQILLLAGEGADASALRAELVAATATVPGAGRQIHVLQMPEWSLPDEWPKVAYRLAIEAGARTIVDCRDTLDVGAINRAVERLESGNAAMVLQAPQAGSGGGAINGLLRTVSRIPHGDFPVRLRAIRVDFLRAVPYEIDSPWPLFDLELLCQAAFLGAEVAVVPGASPSPTASAQEPAVAPPGRLAALRCLLRFEAHCKGMACSLRYRNLAPIRYQDKTGMLYTSHTMALAEVARLRPKKVLDIGCGPGFIAERCRDLGCDVTGLDMFTPLPGKVDTFMTCNIDREPLPVDPFEFDAMLMMDVIEHLHEPEAFLLQLRNRARPLGPGRQPPVFVLSTPNVAFAAVRLNLLLGRFNYAERGILDISHTRLMTRGTLLDLLRDCGYDIISVKPVPIPFEAVVKGRLGRLLGGIMAVCAKVWPTMFAFQFLVVSRPRPGIQQVLTQLTGAPERTDAP